MKNKGLIITIIVLLSLLVLGLGAIMVLVINRGADTFHFSFGGGVSTEKVFEESYDATKVVRIGAEVDAADINFIKSNSAESVSVAIYADEGTTEYVSRLNGDELEIRTKSQCRFACFNVRSARIEVSLPEEFAGKVSITSDAGDIDFGEFKNTAIDINTDAGDIKIAAAKDVRVDADAGDVDIVEAQNIDITSDAGDLDIDYCFGRLALKMDAGDVDINRLALAEDSYIEVGAGDVEIKNVGDVKVDMKGNVGSYNINGGNPSSEITLSIKNDFGDVDVK